MSYNCQLFLIKNQDNNCPGFYDQLTFHHILHDLRTIFESCINRKRTSETVSGFFKRFQITTHYTVSKIIVIFGGTRKNCTNTIIIHSSFMIVMHGCMKRIVDLFAGQTNVFHRTATTSSSICGSHLFVPCFVQLIRQLYVKRLTLSIVFDKKFSGF